MTNQPNNFINPMMGMYGSTPVTCTPMSQQDMMSMCMQTMHQMMQWLQQMMMQMSMAQQGQYATPSTMQQTIGQEEADSREDNILDTDEKFLTKKQVAKLLHVNEVTLWRWHKEERLMYRKVGNSRALYNREDVIKFINSQLTSK